MALHDVMFYRRRIAEEQVKLVTADDPSVQSVHRMLINLYNARLNALGDSVARDG